MTDCPAEMQTQHYKGKWYGFGPLSNCETVIFAVFDTTKRNGSKLDANSFCNRSLTKNTQSLARASFLTRVCFDREIVESGKEEKGALVGVAHAKVDALRKLPAEIPTNSGRKRVRAVCILDRVDKGDFDGHATAGYAEVIEREDLSQKNVGKVRAAIRMDVANLFSDITSADQHRWPWQIEIVAKRIISIMRVVRQSCWGLFHWAHN
jgi:hypothetical protein